tara:strand:- start:96 stop:581 length:486 start_codon:yes stop_codon:yes gene_type:complete
MNKEMVRDLFEYREDNLYWLKTGKGRGDTSKPAGTVNAKGYRRITVKSNRYYAHRLIWLYVNGDFPDNDIDHINGRPLDNRIENLRDATGEENNKNAKKRCDNTSGHVGVHWCKAVEKWMAKIAVDGERKYLGVFNILEDAVEARQAASIKYGFHENHGRD